MGFFNSQSGILNSLKNFWGKNGGEQKLQVAPASHEFYLDNGSMTGRQIKSLNEASVYNYERMGELRKNSAEIRRQYAGHLMVENGAPKEQPVIINRLQDAIRIWLQNMATGDPRISIETLYPDLRPYAFQFELAVNRHLSEIQLGDVFMRATLDAIFSVGMFKTGLGVGALEVFEADGELIDPGRPFSDTIFLDDLMVDMSAKSQDKMDMMGDRYLRPKAWVEEMMKKARNGEPISTIADRNQSEMMPEESMAGTQESDERSRIYDNVWVWDMYLPKENVMVTIADGADEPIAVWEWDGPEGGPYDMLGWYYSPGYPLPIPPAVNLFELHMFSNELMRKVGRQANRQKDVLVVEQGAEKGAKIIRDSDDGGVVTVPRGTLDKMKEIKYGGADPLMQQMLIWSLQTMDTEGGNLQALGGLGPSAETFRGDKLITENASALIKFLQLGLMKTAKSVLKKHAWWVWTEDIREFKGWTNVPGEHDIPIEWSFTPEEREGDFLDFNFDIVPISLVDKTPQEKAQSVLELWQNMIVPNAEMFMQSGYTPNAAETMRYVCKHLNISFDILLKEMDPAMKQEIQGQEQAPQRLQNKHTVNERISRPGTTPNGNDNVMMQSLSKMATSGNPGGDTPALGG